MRFQEAKQRSEHGRLIDAPSKLFSPDSGQVDEPVGPTVVTKRCRKSGKPKSLSVDWRIPAQRLTISRMVGGMNWPRS